MEELSPLHREREHAFQDRQFRNAAAHFDQKGRGFDVLFDSPQTIEQVKGFASHLNPRFDSDEPEHVRDVFLLAGRLLATKLFIRLDDNHVKEAFATIGEKLVELRAPLLSAAHTDVSEDASHVPTAAVA